MSVNEEVRKKMQEENINQKELAAMMHISGAQLSRILSGARHWSFETAQKVVKIWPELVFSYVDEFLLVDLKGDKESQNKG